MATRNIKQIMRKNFVAKPWILSKNSGEVANDCLQKIYRELPNNFKKDDLLLQPKNLKPDNRAPIRTLQTDRPSKVTGPHIRGQRLIEAVVFPSQKIVDKNLVAPNKKLDKPPGYKMYGKRRMSCSTSSSSTTICRGLVGRKRRTDTDSRKDNLSLLLRTFATQGAAAKIRKDITLSPKASTILQAAHKPRLSTTTTPTKPVKNSIQRDLMSIDNNLKKRISLRRSYTTANPIEPKKPDPFELWKHPPAPEHFVARCKERKSSNFEMVEQKRRLQISYDLRERENRRLVEAAVDQVRTTIGRKIKRYPYPEKPVKKQPRSEQQSRVLQQGTTRRLISRQPGPILEDPKLDTTTPIINSNPIISAPNRPPPSTTATYLVTTPAAFAQSKKY